MSIFYFWFFLKLITCPVFPIVAMWKQIAAPRFLPNRINTYQLLLCKRIRYFFFFFFKKSRNFFFFFSFNCLDFFSYINLDEDQWLNKKKHVSAADFIPTSVALVGLSLFGLCTSLLLESFYSFLKKQKRNANNKVK